MDAAGRKAATAARPFDTGDPARNEPVRVVPVEHGVGLDAFLRVPDAIYRDDPQYVAPLRLEKRKRLSPERNPYFRHAEAKLWVAWRAARPVGRVSAQIDRESLARYRDATGHFGFFEAEDDPAVVRALLDEAEGWLASRGMRRVTGPFSLSINDQCGLLVDGFDSPPAFLMGHARPYYGPRLEEAGYGKAKDLLAYDTPVALPEIGRRVTSRLGRQARIAIRTLRWREYDSELRTIMDIFNDAWADNWGFVPLTAAELDHMAREMKPILRDDLVAIGEVDGEAAAMMVALPNLNEIIADLNGRLLPFGWLRLLWRLRAERATSLRVPLMGVRLRHQGTAVGAALMVGMFERVIDNARRRGYSRAELSWVLEDNRAMRHVAESFGARVYKTYRIYEKPLTA